MESLVRMLASWKSFRERECAVRACQSCSHSLGMSELRVWGLHLVLLCVLVPGGGGCRETVPAECYGVLALNTAAWKQGNREADLIESQR